MRFIERIGEDMHFMIEFQTAGKLGDVSTMAHVAIVVVHNVGNF